MMRLSAQPEVIDSINNIVQLYFGELMAGDAETPAPASQQSDS